MRALVAHARSLVGDRATVELEEFEGPSDDRHIQMLVTPRTLGALSVGVIADDEWLILDVGERWGWEPDYSSEGLEFVKATLERTVQGVGPRRRLLPTRTFPAY
ncbi:hypothetical protein [Microbacterium stercoris]|uniref:Uncharacterized protein n=1 Tax=Microbacterium stercoris TaxID=2820289 RepID=A0A939QKU0_9MICO|nr:hypothetical protein [Microbacterium stercoris]MBO3662620.1 hypothetical protein [Microbacterium stercoris]